MKVSTFEQAKNYRSLGFILGLAAIGYAAIFNEILGTVIILGISLYFDSQYKCPCFGKSFDIRENPKKLKYCPHCGDFLS